MKKSPVSILQHVLNYPLVFDGGSHDDLAFKTPPLKFSTSLKAFLGALVGHYLSTV